MFTEPADNVGHELRLHQLCAAFSGRQYVLLKEINYWGAFPKCFFLCTYLSKYPFQLLLTCQCIFSPSCVCVCVFQTVFSNSNTSEGWNSQPGLFDSHNSVSQTSKYIHINTHTCVCLCSLLSAFDIHLLCTLLTVFSFYNQLKRLKPQCPVLWGKKTTSSISIHILPTL